MVLSFHGWTGTGKNYVAKFIAESLFKKGMKSGFVQIFISTVNFPDHSKVDIYKIELQKKIMDTVRGLYLFFNQDIFLPSISLKTNLYSKNIFFTSLLYRLQPSIIHLWWNWQNAWWPCGCYKTFYWLPWGSSGKAFWIPVTNSKALTKQEGQNSKNDSLFWNVRLWPMPFYQPKKQSSFLLT